MVEFEIQGRKRKELLYIYCIKVWKRKGDKGGNRDTGKEKELNKGTGKERRSSKWRE